ncbi:MAG TPA: biotin/lipoyl-containing protein [Rhizomicrobium sp.]
MNLSREDVDEIVGLLNASPFDELSLDTGKFKLTLRRAGGGWTQEHETRAAEAPVSALPAASAKPAPAALEPGTVAITPPLMGTFYRAPKPGAAPFVEVGSRVEPDTAIGIVETMKLMNAVPAGRRGTIVAIVAENGAFVEQDRVLMLLRLAP